MSSVVQYGNGRFPARTGARRVRPASIEAVGPQRWFSTVHVLLRHAGLLAAVVLFPLNGPLCLLFLVSYLVRTWGMEAVYHRYFAHRTYKVSRAFQLVLAIIGTQCGQRGPLWWAYVHRMHHRHADTKQDRHSPNAYSFQEAYFGWMRHSSFSEVDWHVVRDFAAYPELRWLTRYYEVPLELGAAMLALAGYLGWFGPQVSGWSAFLWGYCAPTAVLLHATSLVNTFCHLSRAPGGYQRYPNNSFTVNRPILSLLMLGAAFHNNHHRYASSARLGFAWYELDPTFWSLRLLRACGLVRRLRDDVPSYVLREGGLA